MTPNQLAGLTKEELIDLVLVYEMDNSRIRDKLIKTRREFHELSNLVSAAHGTLTTARDISHKT